MVKRLGLKLKEQKGFTLIELLAVIVILGIIAAIAIPAIGNVIEKSKDDAKVAEAISIIDAARLAYLDLDPTKAAVTGVVTTPASPTTAPVTAVTWTKLSTSTTGPLDNYVSKVEDDAYVVTYDKATNLFSITGHAAADTTTTEAVAGTLTEDELAALAR